MSRIVNAPRSASAPLTAVLLDLDGTITDSATVILDAFTATLTQLELPVPPRRQLMALVGPPLDEGFRIVAGLEGEDNAEAIAIYRQYYRQHMFEAPVYEGVREMLSQLRALGLPLALATSKRRDYAAEILRDAGLDQFFTVVAGAEPSGELSTKAQVVARALEGLRKAGCSTDHVIHVGDRHHDVEGAAACDVDCVGVEWGYGSREELSEARWHVQTPTALVDLVRSLVGPADGGDELPTPQPVISSCPHSHGVAGVVDSMPRWLVRGGLGSWLTLGIVIIVGLVFAAIGHIVPVFIGLFIALVITSILHPLVELFSRVMPRYPATFLALLVAIGFVAGLLTYVVTSVTNQWASLARQFSSGVDTILAFIEHGPLPVHVSQQQVVSTMQNLVSKGQVYVEKNATSLAGEVLSNAGTVVDVFVVLALAIFSAIFFLAAGEKMWRWFLNELPSEIRPRVHRAAGAGWYTFAGYARGTVILALTDAIMAGIFLQIVGVPLAAPLAVLVFIGAFVPMVGAPAAMLVAMVVALASKGVVAMIVVGLGVAGIGQIEGHILQPLIMGRQVSLHPVVVGIAVAVGSFAAGLLGAVIAVPLVSVVWAMFSELHVRDEPYEGDLPKYLPSTR